MNVWSHWNLVAPDPLRVRRSQHPASQNSILHQRPSVRRGAPVTALVESRVSPVKTPGRDVPESGENLCSTKPEEESYHPQISC